MKRTARGFTLIELLVVIAILAILAVIAAQFLNPFEFPKRSRDAARLADLAGVQQAISIAAQEATTSSDTVLCGGGSAPCQDDSKSGTRVVDGTGWVRVNFTTQKSISFPTLPVDQLNTDTYKYSYYSDGDDWEINAVLESDQYKDKMGTDGGDNPNAYEIGSKLTLIN